MNVTPAKLEQDQRILRDRWKEASLKTAFRFSDDWQNRYVDEIVSKLTKPSTLQPIVKKLGKARAEAGCGLAETIDDFMCLVNITKMPQGALLVGELAMGWTKTNEEQIATANLNDGYTGVPSKQYLLKRSKEQYLKYSLDSYLSKPGIGVLALLPWDYLDTAERISFGATFGRAFNDTFKFGEPAGKLKDGSYFAIIEDHFTIYRNELMVRFQRYNKTKNVPQLLLTKIDLPHNYNTFEELLNNVGLQY